MSAMFWPYNCAISPRIRDIRLKLCVKVDWLVVRLPWVGRANGRQIVGAMADLGFIFRIILI